MARLAVVLFFLVACLTPGFSQDTPANSTALTHIIWMLEENRSFDNYYGSLNSYRVAHGKPASVDGIPPGASNPAYSGIGTVPAFHLNTVCIENVTPSWDESRRDIDRANVNDPATPMNGYVYSAAHYAIDEDKSRPGSYADVKGIRAMGYYTERELPYYYYLATQFAISDRFFSPILSRTPANRVANFAASALGNVNSVSNCCSTYPNIFSLLQQHGVSWKIYEMASHTTLGYFGAFYSQYHTGRVVPISQYFTDLKNNALPSVAFIESGGSDEHPDTNAQIGAAGVAVLINALTHSASWGSSVFILTYDEGGGLYDHVPPQPAAIPDSIPPRLGPGMTKDTYSRTGFRIPMTVISPFAKIGYVSHTVMDTTAILKFIETRFGLPSLTARDAAQPPFDEFFDFVGVPNKAIPSPPAQPTNAPCTIHKLP
jgi:phospholipase C